MSNTTAYSRSQFKNIALLLLVLILIIGWLAWGNKSLVTTNYTVSSSRLSASFNGFKIVQISDLHNAEFGQNNETLIKRIEEAQPDIIVLTGDLIDSHKTRVDVAVQFAEKAQGIAQTYFITGNHEAVARSANEELENQLEDAGVIILHNANAEITRGQESINIAGIDDPSFVSSVSTLDDRLNKALTNDSYSVLLAHHPEELATYAEHQADLVLAGHVHGGQFRLPFIGGIIAPDQGLFPKYDAGTYQEGDTTLVLSRGLGNSLIPVRVNNRPEIVVVTLERN